MVARPGFGGAFCLSGLPWSVFFVTLFFFAGAAAPSRHTVLLNLVGEVMEQGRTDPDAAGLVAAFTAALGPALARLAAQAEDAAALPRLLRLWRDRHLFDPAAVDAWLALVAPRVSMPPPTEVVLNKWGPPASILTPHFV